MDVFQMRRRTQSPDVSRKAQSMFPKNQKESFDKSISCSICGNICAHMSFSITELSNKTKVFSVGLTGFTQQLSVIVTEPVYYQLKTLYQIGDSKKLYAFDLEFAPYYCPKCDLNYCSQHWRIL